MATTTTCLPESADYASTNHLRSTNFQQYDPQTIPATATTEIAATNSEPDSFANNPEPDFTSAHNKATATTSARWPGWPGDCVFRLIVPVLKVGSIIGRKGDLVRKMCDQTGARIRVLDAPIGTSDRVVLISGKEELEAALSPAMDAVLRIFKRVTGLPEDDDKESGAAGLEFCTLRLLVASTQAISLIGKQGSLIRSIQEGTGASMVILSEDRAPFYVAADERIVELQGEALKVLKALEAIVGHLRKFLVDHSVLPLFEKNYNAIISQDHQAEMSRDKSYVQNASQGVDTDYPLSAQRGALIFERESPLEAKVSPSRISLYRQDLALSSIHSLPNHRGGPVITQITQTMQVPISYAEEIIGIGGNNIEYIRRTSGAIVTVRRNGLPDEITVEIKGSASEVQIAQQLIQEFLGNYDEPVTSRYSKYDSRLRSLYYQLDDTPYSPSHLLSGKSFRGYGFS